MSQSNYDPYTRKILSALSHRSLLFSWAIITFGIPLAILLISEDPVAQANAREALNFLINIFFYALIFALLSLVIIGIPLFIALAIFSFIMPIVAIVKIAKNPDLQYRYPFIFRLF